MEMEVITSAMDKATSRDEKLFRDLLEQVDCEQDSGIDQEYLLIGLIEDLEAAEDDSEESILNGLLPYVRFGQDSN